MKLLKILDSQSAKLVTDVINQAILKELVNQPQSVSDLTVKLNIPTLKLWRRIQKLQKANLIEQTGTQKKGNLEKKLYRSTATYFAPQQFLNFKPKNPQLTTAFEIYSEIQNILMTKMAAYNEVPQDADPVDYSLYANMVVFADICGQPRVQARIVELERELTKFKEQGGYKPSS
ncbi:MAG: winged helix-turn-helix domain-containing protein [Candidatus Bathyarchaeota archaeon]|nr:winged helix-turn-helix domain-containing protein [Candidatus Bathyarchaeota archaeon]